MKGGNRARRSPGLEERTGRQREKKGGRGYPAGNGKAAKGKRGFGGSGNPAQSWGFGKARPGKGKGERARGDGGDPPGEAGRG